MSENGSGIQARMTEITPAIAVKLLARNKHNRPVNHRTVARYATDIRRGDWQLNGEAIKTSVDNQVLDGQHRLLAVIEADRPMQTLLITGLQAGAQETMDQGRNRSFSDVLKLRGESDYCSLGAAVRMVFFYEDHGTPVAGVAPTVAQLSRTLERNPEIRDSLKLANRLRRPWLNVTTIAGMHYLFSIADREDADDFFRKVATGEGLLRADAPYVLRERLIKEHHAPVGPHPRIKAGGKLAFIVRGWNAYRRGERLERLVWNPGGANPDRFPDIDGLAMRPEPANALVGASP